VLALAQQMTFAAVARLVNESWHRVHAICSRYVDLAVAQADLSAVSAVGIDETSCRRGHDYLTIAADAAERRVVFVTEGRDATTVGRFAEHLTAHKARPEQITTVSIDMSRPSSAVSPTTCRKRASPLTNSMSSSTPRPPSIRPDGLNNGTIPASKACAGHCSGAATGCPPMPAPTSML
jgi:hypothetical protein